MTELQALQILATSPRFLAVLGVILYAVQRRAAIGVGIRRIASRAKSLIVKVKPEGGVQLSMPSLPTVLLAAAIVMGLAQRGCTWPDIPWPIPIPIIDNAPIDAPGLHVLIVEETEDRTKLNQAQANIMDSLVWREYVEGKGGDWQLLDDDVTGEAEKWQKALQRPRTASPWVIVSNGKTGEECPLPATLDDLMALLRKYGG